MNQCACTSIIMLYVVCVCARVRVCKHVCELICIHVYMHVYMCVCVLMFRTDIKQINNKL